MNCNWWSGLLAKFMAKHNGLPFYIYSAWAVLVLKFQVVAKLYWDGLLLCYRTWGRQFPRLGSRLGECPPGLLHQTFPITVEKYWMREQLDGLKDIFQSVYDISVVQLQDTYWLLDRPRVVMIRDMHTILLWSKWTGLPPPVVHRLWRQSLSFTQLTILLLTRKPGSPI